MVKVIVCRIGQDPIVEEVDQPFFFAKNELIGGGYIEAQLIKLGTTRVVAFWDEDSKVKKRAFNRAVPHECQMVGITPDFVVDTREQPPEMYAKPGELGFFNIFGNFLITKADNKGDYRSLSEEEINSLLPHLTLPKCENCKSVPVAYAGAKYCGAACTAESEMHK